jgi:hypothetical protein
LTFYSPIGQLAGFELYKTEGPEKSLKMDFRKIDIPAQKYHAIFGLKMAARLCATTVCAVFLKKKLSFMARFFNFKFGSKIRDFKRKIKSLSKVIMHVIYVEKLVNRLFCKI